MTRMFPESVMWSRLVLPGCQQRQAIDQAQPPAELCLTPPVTPNPPPTTSGGDRSLIAIMLLYGGAVYVTGLTGGHSRTLIAPSGGGGERSWPFTKIVWLAERAVVSLMPVWHLFPSAFAFVSTSHVASVSPCRPCPLPPPPATRPIAQRCQERHVFAVEASGRGFGSGQHACGTLWTAVVRAQCRLTFPPGVL